MSVLEDEYHAVIVYPRYADIRLQYIKSYYITRPSMYKFIQLLNTDNLKEMHKLATFTKHLFITYGEYLFI